jgi:hypothetical protein
MRGRGTRNGRKALTATRAVARARRRRRGGGLKMVRRQGKEPPSPPPLRFISRRGELSGADAPLALTAGNLPFTSTDGPHHDCSGHVTAGWPSSRRRPAGLEVKPSRPPATPPTTRARPQRLKRRARAAKNRSLDYEAFNDRVPCQAKRTLERGEPLAQDQEQPSMGYRRERVARDLLDVKQAPRALMPRKTLERHEPSAQNENSPRWDIGARGPPGTCLM